MTLQIAVIGPGECTPEEALAAEKVGEIIAREEAVLICGGLGGVMESACRGAWTRGGLTVGILPHAGEGNHYLSITIRSGLSQARNPVVVQSADSVVAIGGAYGTLSEIAHALKVGKAVFSYRSWEIPGMAACDSPEDAAIRAIAAARR